MKKSMDYESGILKVDFLSRYMYPGGMASRRISEDLREEQKQIETVLNANMVPVQICITFSAPLSRQQSGRF
ncbi:hypothetical protein VTN00DRAFT_4473 [Thermoascus crustaceus]|uniref:uncharacterized protein n=1 Tax=Thermoascus crustaceus TaxID=5088 RepID=UPI0037440E72